MEPAHAMTPAQEVKKRMEGKPCPDCGKESWGVCFTHPNNDLSADKVYFAECNVCHWNERTGTAKVRVQQRDENDSQGQGYKSKVE